MNFTYLEYNSQVSNFFSNQKKLISTRNFGIEAFKKQPTNFI